VRSLLSHLRSIQQNFKSPSEERKELLEKESKAYMACSESSSRLAWQFSQVTGKSKGIKLLYNRLLG
jgi:hypothetical protein